jgi:alkylation response protein AidB-like acyl-CoA dehydrogenase
MSDVFVPEHLSFELPAASLDRMSAREVFRTNMIGLSAVLCGLAREILADLVARAASTRRLMAFNSLADDHIMQYGLADYAGRLEAARTHVLSIVARIDDEVGSRASIGDELGNALLQACHALMNAAKEAAMFAFWQAPASSVYLHDPLQRRVRDLLVGSKHTIFNPANLARVGQARITGA